ncbi:DUF2460 domain-containing protein [uncultured Parvibaculum sp.]|uniref:DUF2460 domain-containing protein n=1 Tax=uncultured Parvibaculum sp. TaxID=291828 RepID=UPI0030DD3825
MTFHDIRFPTDLSFGASGGPERRTEIVTLGSGFEERNSPWAQSRRKFNAGLGLRRLDDVHETIAFFEARHGRLYGFRWKDHADWKSCAPGGAVSAMDQTLGTGDGETTRFQLLKAYASGGESYLRRIAKPVAGSVVAAVDGVARAVTLDAATGEILFDDPPAPGAEVTAGYKFDVPVRFDTDFLDINLAAFEAGSVPDIPVVELRL